MSNSAPINGVLLSHRERSHLSSNDNNVQGTTNVDRRDTTNADRQRIISPNPTQGTAAVLTQGSATSHTEADGEDFPSHLILLYYHQIKHS